MIPNIFISSTIADLHYLRDGIRDAIEELAYRPVMSEHGDIGYIYDGTAAESCYVNVKQCQMVVLIVGHRYGDVGKDGLSVTHREYRVAREHSLPTITLIEPQVLNFKEVFDAEPTAAMWDKFPKMENAKKTFQLIDEINSSEAFNGLIGFESAGDAKRRLKQQIAHFFGALLNETFAPMSSQIRDVLAEVKTLRNAITHQGGATPAAAQTSRAYLTVARTLLSDSFAEYRRVLEQLFGDLDVAIEIVHQCADFGAVLNQAGWTEETLVALNDAFPGDPLDLPADAKVEYISSSIGTGTVAMCEGKHLLIGPRLRLDFDSKQQLLYINVHPPRPSLTVKRTSRTDADITPAGPSSEN